MATFLYVTITLYMISLTIMTALILRVLVDISNSIHNSLNPVDEKKLDAIGSKKFEIPEFFQTSENLSKAQWAYGYWTGPDKSHLCITYQLPTVESCEEYLSPLRGSPASAVEAFVELRKEKGVFI